MSTNWPLSPANLPHPPSGNSPAQMRHHQSQASSSSHQQQHHNEEEYDMLSTLAFAIASGSVPSPDDHDDDESLSRSGGNHHPQPQPQSSGTSRRPSSAPYMIDMSTPHTTIAPLIDFNDPTTYAAAKRKPGRPKKDVGQITATVPAAGEGVDGDEEEMGGIAGSSAAGQKKKKPLKTPKPPKERPPKPPKTPKTPKTSKPPKSTAPATTTPSDNPTPTPKPKRAREYNPTPARKEANRQAAERSRVRKAERAGLLEIMAKGLTEENVRLRERVRGLEAMGVAVGVGVEAGLGEVEAGGEGQNDGNEDVDMEQNQVVMENSAGEQQTAGTAPAMAIAIRLSLQQEIEQSLQAQIFELEATLKALEAKAETEGDRTEQVDDDMIASTQTQPVSHDLALYRDIARRLAQANEDLEDEIKDMREEMLDLGVEMALPLPLPPALVEGEVDVGEAEAEQMGRDLALEERRKAMREELIKGEKDVEEVILALKKHLGQLMTHYDPAFAAYEALSSEPFTLPERYELLPLPEPMRRGRPKNPEELERERQKKLDVQEARRRRVEDAKEAREVARVQRREARRQMRVMRQERVMRVPKPKVQKVKKVKKAVERPVQRTTSPPVVGVPHIPNIVMHPALPGRRQTIAKPRKRPEQFRRFRIEGDPNVYTEIVRQVPGEGEQVVQVTSRLLPGAVVNPPRPGQSIAEHRPIAPQPRYEYPEEVGASHDGDGEDDDDTGIMQV